MQSIFAQITTVGNKRGKKSKTQTALDLGVSTNVLYNWIYEFGSEYGGESRSHIETDNPEIIRLRKALVKAEMERDILKKAAAVFK
jgi:transposase-like protein